MPRKPYPSDVTDDVWAVVAPYLTLMRPDAPQRIHAPCEAVYQQTRRWLDAGCFEDMVHDLRAMLRWLDRRADAPTAVILDRRTGQSTPEICPDLCTGGRGTRQRADRSGRPASSRFNSNRRK